MPTRDIYTKILGCVILYFFLFFSLYYLLCIYLFIAFFVYLGERQFNFFAILDGIILTFLRSRSPLWSYCSFWFFFVILFQIEWQNKIKIQNDCHYYDSFTFLLDWLNDCLCIRLVSCSLMSIHTFSYCFRTLF